MLMVAVDEAGPLWLLMENFLDWLGFWGRIAFLIAGLLVVLVALALATRGKNKRHHIE